MPKLDTPVVPMAMGLDRSRLNQPQRIVIGNSSRKVLPLRIFLCALCWLPLGALLTVSLFAWSQLRDYAAGLPREPNLSRWERSVPQSSVIVAADRTLLAELPFRHNELVGYRKIAKFEEIPRSLILAVLAAEDRRFFEHRGVDYRALVRAGWENYRANRIVQGASTITQQLARNLVNEIGSERSLRRKVREALVARRLEKVADKKSILAAYLNYVFLGNNYYGVAAAAQGYFSKELSQLTIAESALLAGLIQIPGRGNPLSHPEVALKRRQVVLDRMLAAGFIDSGEWRENSDKGLALRVRTPRYGSIAPWPMEETRRQMAESMPKLLAQGGLRIELSIEPVEQAQSEALLAQHSALMVNEEDESAQGAALFVSRGSGFVRAMVGGRDWKESQFNRATQACRQPGSAFKPIYYGAGLQEGAISPASVLRDAPISEYDESLRVFWKPRNAGHEFQGALVAHEALVHSLNAPAIDVFDRLGGEKVQFYAKKLGIHSPLSDLRPLALGASCVKMSELLGAYGAIADVGTPLKIRLIKSIHQADRVVSESIAIGDPYLSGAQRLDRVGAAQPPAQVTSEDETFDEFTRYQLTAMLKDVTRRGTGRLARLLPFEVAGKTGTTNGNRDAWFVGFSPRVLGAVWLGHDSPKKSLGRGREGGKSALPLWKKIVLELEDGRNKSPLLQSIPLGSVEVKIDVDTGLLAGPGSGASVNLLFRKGREPRERAGGGAAIHRDFARGSQAF